MLFRTLRHTGRLLSIARILAREDALFILDELDLPVIALAGKAFSRKRRGWRPGQRLAAAIQQLGPAFIKLGQALSTRSDLVGEELAEDLSGLRDRLPPFAAATARATIEAELGMPVSALFSAFNDVPVAAASIAQVHRATTLEGNEVAIKILRPRIDALFARDLELFYWLAEIMERRLPGWRRLKPREVVTTLKESMFFELDLRFEAAAAAELAENIKRHEPGLRVPQIDWNRTSKSVMTSEWVDGIRLSDAAAIHASGFDCREILAKAARSLFAQVFQDGFFHADLHPGNLFLDANGDLVAVDFGIMGRLDWNSRVYMAQILRGFLTEDYRHVAEMHFAAGYVPAGKSIDAFTQACMAVARPITGKPVNEISVARLLGQMFAIAAEFEMETQPQLLLLQKTMMVSEGVGRMLDPSLNMWQLATPLIEAWVREHLGPLGRAKAAAKQGVDVAKRLPQLAVQAESALRALSDPAGIKLHPHTLLAMEASQQGRQRSWLALAWAALGTIALLGLLVLRHR